MSSEPVKVGGVADGSLLGFVDSLRAPGSEPAARSATALTGYVTFFLRDDEYGVPILQCREIVRVSTITRVPEAPVHVRGVVSLRGHIVPVVDARARAGLAGGLPTPRSRLLVVEVAGRQLALLVDRVARVVKLASGDIEAPPPGVAVPGITGVGRVEDRRITLLDAEGFLRDEAASPPTKGEAT